jgi:hypothetical protein
MSGIYEVERGNCSGVVARPENSVKLNTLELGAKFISVHQDGSVGQIPWYIISFDGSYAAIAQRRNAGKSELVMIHADSPVRVID